MGLRIGWEIKSITDALAGVQVIADALVHDQLATAHDERRALNAIPAIVGLVRDRLDRLKRVVEGDADPADLITDHNEDAAEDVHNGVVVLQPWSVPERVRRHQDELARLRRRQEREGESR